MAKGKDASATPVMLQFKAAKAAHPDALVFFRMGDFYELFFEDAVVAARALDLTLTSRNKNAEDPIPMAGVPHHAASAYVQRLTEQGFRVAICEQMADPSKVKGIVPRDVVRVVSPGVAFDDAGIPPKENLFLAALVKEPAKGKGAPSRYGIAAFDLSTGELVACEVLGDDAALAAPDAGDDASASDDVGIDAPLDAALPGCDPATRRDLFAWYRADLGVTDAGLPEEYVTTHIRKYVPSPASLLI